MNMNSATFWSVTLPGATFWSVTLPAAYWLLFYLFFYPEEGGSMFF
jgi:hypothetical protein